MMDLIGASYWVNVFITLQQTTNKWIQTAEMREVRPSDPDKPPSFSGPWGQLRTTPGVSLCLLRRPGETLQRADSVPGVFTSGFVLYTDPLNTTWCSYLSLATELDGDSFDEACWCNNWSECWASGSGKQARRGRACFSFLASSDTLWSHSHMFLSLNPAWRPPLWASVVWGFC